MSTLILYGYLTALHGPAEEHFVIEIDSDQRGIENPAMLDKNSFTFKSGLCTYAGALPCALPLSLSSSSSNATSAATIGLRYCGNYFHDEYSGIEGDIPRGSFFLRLSRLPTSKSSRDVKWMSFDGTATSQLSVGKPLKLLTAFDTVEAGKDRKILSHPGKYNPENNDFELVEKTIEGVSSSTVTSAALLAVDEKMAQGKMTMMTSTITTVYKGKWAETQQNAKFCGTFVTFRESGENTAPVVIEQGNFFTIASEVTLE